MSSEVIKCPLCDEFTSKQEPRFYKHLSEIHNVVDVEGLYARLFCVGSVKQACACGCGSTVKWAGWKLGYTSKFIRGHNASLDSVWLNKERRAEFVEKRTEGYRSGRLKVWNDGLTNETDERMRQRSEKTSQTLRKRRASGEIIDWWIKDPEKAKVAKEKAKQTKRRRYESGELVPWNKGLTKTNDSRVAEIGSHISEVLRNTPGLVTKRFTPEQFVERFATQAQFELLDDPKDYRNKYQKFAVKCKECGKTSHKSLMMLMATPVCFYCHPKESKGQLDLFKFVSSLAPDARLSDRTVIHPKELDVYVPSASLGIEYDGLYWHSELFVPPNHADLKVAACGCNGIKLLRVYEDEWRDRRPFMESLIKHKLGLFDRRIDAGECSIVELSTSDRRAFFESNHIDGDDERYQTAWGLECEDGTIVSAISVASFVPAPCHVRFCQSLGTFVAGAPTRLITHVKNVLGQSIRLVARVNPRHESISDYRSIGFNDIDSNVQHVSWWTDFVSRRSTAPDNSSPGAVIHGCSTITVTLT